LAEVLKEAGYPCPACGSPLYGWTAAHDPLDRGKRIVLDRCESCGLAVTRAATAPDANAELEPLLSDDGSGRVRLTAPNRRSLQGGLGGAQWAGLEPELRRLHLNPESLRLLLAERGLEVENVRTPFGKRSRRLMVQTMINAFTYRDNFLRNARAGRIPRGTTGERWLYRLDWLVSYLVYLPSAFFGVLLEAIGAVMGRGGVMEVEARRTSVS
jgi:hypothetical protein